MKVYGVCLVPSCGAGTHLFSLLMPPYVYKYYERLRTFTTPFGQEHASKG